MRLGWIARERGDRRSAEHHFGQAAVIYNKLGYQEQAGLAFTELGDLAMARGDRDEARDNYGKALARYTNAGKRQEPTGQALIRALNELRG